MTDTSIRDIADTDPGMHPDAGAQPRPEMLVEMEN